MTLISDFKKFARHKAKELQKLAEADVTIDTAEVNVAGQKLQFKVNVERRAAWKLYVELNTRITTQPLKPNEGLLREALSSLHSVFAITREILKEAGPGVAQGRESIGFYAMEILNQVLRPVLATWHPALAHWEEQRDATVSPVEHEKAWDREKELRKALDVTRKTLIGYCDALAILAGVSPTTKGATTYGKTKSVRYLRVEVVSTPV